MTKDSADAAGYNDLGRDKLPGLLGIEILELGAGMVRARLDVMEKHRAPNGYLHAAAIVGLLDTACGYGCVASLPEGAPGFTTLELKANFLGTLREGGLGCEARVVHSGRTTQVWDASAYAEETGRTIALFRCTQLILRADQ
ncbi:MAG: PaaI family thioesterase [Acidimicrobiia bacterium]